MELLEDKSDDFGQRKSSGTHHSKSQSQMPYNLRKRTRKKDWDCGATNKKAKQKRTTRVHIDRHKTSTKSRTPITDTLIGKPKRILPKMIQPKASEKNKHS